MHWIATTGLMDKVIFRSMEYMLSFQMKAKDRNYHLHHTHGNIMIFSDPLPKDSGETIYQGMLSLQTAKNLQSVFQNDSLLSTDT